MSEDVSDEDFCYKENAFFPRRDFFDHPTWGRVHNKAPRHTILGQDIDEDEPLIGPLPDPPAR